MSAIVKIFNGTFLTLNRILKEGTLIIKDGKIDTIGKENIEVPDDAVCIDAQENYVSPGFIDIHVHGGGGHDFMDGEVEDFLKIAECHVKYGTTAMVPTTLTSEKEGLFHTLELYGKANAINDKGASFLGMHLEGPYFAMNQRGAQDPRYIRNPEPKEYREVVEKFRNAISRWSAAPELPGAIEFGRYMRSQGILTALAHTNAIYEEVVKGFDAGYTLATHLYSGMSGVTRRNAYRYAGVIESAYIIDGMDVELIADGVHLPGPLLKLAYKIKGPDRIALTTDAMRGAGMPEGDSILGSKHTGLKVIIEDGVAKLPDRSSFAGSVATTDRLVRTMMTLGEVPLLDTIKMITSTPARIMGVQDKQGTLACGLQGDLVIFDKNVNVQYTLVKGNILYKRR